MSDTVTEPVNLKRVAATTWAGILMRRMKCGTIEDVHYAKIRPTCIAGVPKLAVMSEVSQAEAECALHQKIYSWAYDQLVSGRELPRLEVQVIEPSHMVMGLFRLNRLKDVLKLRAKDFGRQIHAIPAESLARLTHEIDAVITRHAMQL